MLGLPSPFPPRGGMVRAAASSLLLSWANALRRRTF